MATPAPAPASANARRRARRQRRGRHLRRIQRGVCAVLGASATAAEELEQTRIAFPARPELNALALANVRARPFFSRILHSVRWS